MGPRSSWSWIWSAYRGLTRDGRFSRGWPIGIGFCSRVASWSRGGYPSSYSLRLNSLGFGISWVGVYREGKLPKSLWRRSRRLRFPNPRSRGTQPTYIVSSSFGSFSVQSSGLLIVCGRRITAQPILYDALEPPTSSRPAAFEGFCADCGHEVGTGGGYQYDDRQDSQERWGGGINAFVHFADDRIEEDEEPLMVPSSLSESSWFAPGSSFSPTQSNDNGLDLTSSDGFQPKPKYYHEPNDIPDTISGSSSLVAPPPQRPVLPQFSDPWSNYTPEDRVEPS